MECPYCPMPTSGSKPVFEELILLKDPETGRHITGCYSCLKQRYPDLLVEVAA